MLCSGSISHCWELVTLLYILSIFVKYFCMHQSRAFINDGCFGSVLMLNSVIYSMYEIPLIIVVVYDCVVCIRVGYFYMTATSRHTWSLTHYAIMYSYTHEYILIKIIVYELLWSEDSSNNGFTFRSDTPRYVCFDVVALPRSVPSRVRRVAPALRPSPRTCLTSTTAKPWIRRRRRRRAATITMCRARRP